MEEKTIFNNKIFKNIIRLLAVLFLIVGIFSIISALVSGRNMVAYLFSNWLGIIVTIAIPLFYLWPDINHYYGKNK
jgi:hypothetical protein